MPKPVALVTGSSSGIGRTTAAALAKAGWRVALSGRREEELKAAAEECAQAAKEGGKPWDEKDVLYVAGDVGKEENVVALFKEISEKFGRLDLLFNNAGISGKNMPLEDLDMDKFLAVMSINVTGSVLCAKYAVKFMKEQTPQGGRIINNGSISAQVPRPNAVPYTVSKHAISGLTKCIALDGRKYNIACSQIDIGNAATAMGGGATLGVPQADGTIKPEPVFNANEVGDAVVYMAGLPLGTNVFNLTIMATNMPSMVGRG